MTDNSQAPRFEKSLGLLTTKFVSLLQKSKGGILDLKVVCTQDKLVQKSNKNSILFILGGRPFRSATKTTNLRYHQCVGRYWTDREKKQEQYSVEVSLCLLSCTSGSINANLQTLCHPRI